MLLQAQLFVALIQWVIANIVNRVSLHIRLQLSNAVLINLSSPFATASFLGAVLLRFLTIVRIFKERKGEAAISAHEINI